MSSYDGQTFSITISSTHRGKNSVWAHFDARENWRDFFLVLLNMRWRCAEEFTFLNFINLAQIKALANQKYVFLVNWVDFSLIDFTSVLILPVTPWMNNRNKFTIPVHDLSDTYMLHTFEVGHEIYNHQVWWEFHQAEIWSTNQIVNSSPSIANRQHPKWEIIQAFHRLADPFPHISWRPHLPLVPIKAIEKVLHKSL